MDYVPTIIAHSAKQQTAVDNKVNLQVGQIFKTSFFIWRLFKFEIQVSFSFFSLFLRPFASRAKGVII